VEEPCFSQFGNNGDSVDSGFRDNIIEGMELPWYAKPAVILGKFYPEITIKKVYKEDKLPPYLPKEPKCWSRDDVNSWISYTLESHNLPVPPLHRFSMNGKALCLMSLDMFAERVPLGGKLLYKDFKIRMAKAGHYT
jgi:hypothetical protein